MSIQLIGYSDKLSGRAGDTINFKVSNKLSKPVTASLKRSISADPNPKGLGILETACDHLFPELTFLAEHQTFHPGSFAQTEERLKTKELKELDISISLCPTILRHNSQTIVAWGDIEIELTSSGEIEFSVSDRKVISSRPLSLNRWYRLSANLRAHDVLTLCITELRGDPSEKKLTSSVTDGFPTKVPVINAHFCLAASRKNGIASHHFNGRLEAPRISFDGLKTFEWDFSKDIYRKEIKSHFGPCLRLINEPTRAVCGSTWNGSEFNWKHKPDHYAAIHFNEDDIYDFGWKDNFSWKIPNQTPSGIYVMRIESNGHEDAMPIFVCPPKGFKQSKLCLLVSTFTYAIYGNHARPDYDSSWQKRIEEWKAYPHNPAENPEYGLSTYNTHPDGNGICHASHKRPLFNLRPGYITFGAASCSGLRHFQADSHLVSWLHNYGIDYDVITDDELDREGIEAISGYSAVATGSHPEYHTANTLDALTAYRDLGGNLMYLGGNGFYWRIARHQQDPDLLEIRRAEDGLRAWASKPGEYYHAFDGAYGGLWRRNGRAPQKLVGIGFTAQGVFEGMPYKRVCFDADFDWVFEGIEDGPIGDFGFSGNGAAGFELDRVDATLSSDHEITILAQAHGNSFMLVPEEQLTHLTNLSGGDEVDAKRADMVYFRTETGGQVFSVGSITFCGSLPWNQFDNNVSRLLYNVMKRFML